MNEKRDKSTNRRVLTLAAISLLIAGIVGSALFQENVQAQSNSTAGQNQTNMIMGAANITGSIPLRQTIAKAITSELHVSLANASLIAEKAVGSSAHAVSVRLGIVQGSLVYIALVVDSNNNFHHVFVDPGNGKVLASGLLLMNGGMGMGRRFGGAGMGMKAHEIGPHLGIGAGLNHRGILTRPGAIMARP